MNKKDESRKSLPSLVEILAIWLLANLVSLSLALLVKPYVTLGQALGPTLVQAISAFVVSLIFGYFYEKTENYLGTSLLHNLFDIAGAVSILLVTL